MSILCERPFVRKDFFNRRSESDDKGWVGESKGITWAGMRKRGRREVTKVNKAD